MTEYDRTQHKKKFRPLKYIIPAAILIKAALLMPGSNNQHIRNPNDTTKTYSSTQIWENNTQYIDNNLQVVNSQSQDAEKINPFFESGSSDSYRNKLDSMTQEQRINYVMSEMKKTEELTKGAYNPQSHQMNSINLGTDTEAPKINLMTPQSGTIYNSKTLDYILLERDNKPPVIQILSPIHQMNYVKLGDTAKINNE